MTKEATARVVTLGVLAAALGFVGYRQTPRPDAAAPAEATPQSAIDGMLDASRAGNAEQYLGYFSGSLRDSLRQTMTDQGAAVFARQLQEQTAGLTGIAMQDPQLTPEGQARVRAEYVYRDRNEVQTFTLERQGTEWKIVRAESPERVKTLVPYGTPVN
jgi:hypothetical protein